MMETLAKSMELAVSLAFIYCTLRGAFLVYRRRNILKALKSYENAVVFAWVVLLIDAIKLLSADGSGAFLDVAASVLLVVVSTMAWNVVGKKVERERAARTD
jgi:hypothetical protein